MVGGRRGAVGPRDHGLGAVAAVHLAVGRQGVAVAVEDPGAWREAGACLRRGTASPEQDRAEGLPWPELLWEGPRVGPELGGSVLSGARPTLGPPQPTRGPTTQRLTHGPQVGPSRRAVWGRLAHQLVDRGQLADAPVGFVHGREDRPVGGRLQVAPARKVTTVWARAQATACPSVTSAPAKGGWEP